MNNEEFVDRAKTIHNVIDLEKRSRNIVKDSKTIYEKLAHVSHENAVAYMKPIRKAVESGNGIVWEFALSTKGVAVSTVTVATTLNTNPLPGVMVGLYVKGGKGGVPAHDLNGHEVAPRETTLTHGHAVAIFTGIPYGDYIIRAVSTNPRDVKIKEIPVASEHASITIDFTTSTATPPTTPGKAYIAGHAYDEHGKRVLYKESTAAIYFLIKPGTRDSLKYTHEGKEWSYSVRAYKDEDGSEAFDFGDELPIGTPFNVQGIKYAMSVAEENQQGYVNNDPRLILIIRDPNTDRYNDLHVVFVPEKGGTGTTPPTTPGKVYIAGHAYDEHGKRIPYEPTPVERGSRYVLVHPNTTEAILDGDKLYEAKTYRDTDGSEAFDFGEHVPQGIPFAILGVNQKHGYGHIDDRADLALEIKNTETYPDIRIVFKERTCVIKGVVEMEDGTEFHKEGAVARLELLQPNEEGKFTIVGTEDETPIDRDGVFTFTHARAGVYYGITILEKEGDYGHFVPRGTGKAVITTSFEKEQHFVGTYVHRGNRKENKTGTVHGTVHDGTGKLLEGGIAHLHTVQGERQGVLGKEYSLSLEKARTKINADGTFTLGIPVGTPSVIVIETEKGEGKFKVDGTNDATIELSMEGEELALRGRQDIESMSKEKTGAIMGHVIFNRGQEMPENATIAILAYTDEKRTKQANKQGTTEPLITRADHQGFFKLEGVPLKTPLFFRLAAQYPLNGKDARISSESYTTASISSLLDRPGYLITPEGVPEEGNEGPAIIVNEIKPIQGITFFVITPDEFTPPRKEHSSAASNEVFATLSEEDKVEALKAGLSEKSTKDQIESWLSTRVFQKLDTKRAE